MCRISKMHTHLRNSYSKFEHGHIKCIDQIIRPISVYGDWVIVNVEIEMEVWYVDFREPNSTAGLRPEDMVWTVDFQREYQICRETNRRTIINYRKKLQRGRTRNENT